MQGYQKQMLNKPFLDIFISTCHKILPFFQILWYVFSSIADYIFLSVYEEREGENEER